MKTINLRKLYFSQYHEDVFVEVSDEVAEALLLMQRAENNRRQKINYYKAYYSIDCVDGIEMAAIHRKQLSPEDFLIELAEQDEWNCILRTEYIAKGGNAYCYFSLHHQAGTAQQGKICRCRCCISQWDKAGQRVGRHDA